MIKEIMLASAILFNDSNITINNFYRNRVNLATIYYGEEMDRNQPIYFYDPFTNRIAYESGYYYNNSNYIYDNIEQELDRYGVYETSPISLLNEDFYPYAGSYTYDYYYFDLRFDLRDITPGRGNWLHAEEPLYFVVSTFDISGEFQDSFSVELSPLTDESYNEYSFSLSDYLGYLYYKPELSEAGIEITDFDTAYRYIGFSLFDSNYQNSYNIDFGIDISLTEWEYCNSNDGINYDGSIDLMEDYINNSIIIDSEQYRETEAELNDLYNTYYELEERYLQLQSINEDLRQENEELNSKHALSNIFEIVRGAFDGIINFLEIELMPNLTIGTIIFIPVVIGVIFFILKALVL